ncbi:MAG: hypothetical protein JNL38_14590 [Myxococcales bacterium]|nr:hypothetical protein [Myxococcales bacterium]
MRLPRARRLAIAATTLASGCSLAVSLDALQGGATSAPSPDAASVDVVGADAPAPAADARADRAVEAGPPFCPSHPGHSLCLSFDEDASIPPDIVLAGDGSALEVVPLGLSAPGALRAAVPAGKVDLAARSEITIPVATKTVHYEMSVKRGAPDTPFASGFLSLVSFVCDFPSGTGGAFVHFIDGEVRLRRISTDGSDAGQDEKRAVVAWPGDGAWHRIVLDVTLGASGSASLSVDGAKVTVSGPMLCTGATHKYVSLGIRSNGSEARGAYEVLYDDVLGDFK